MPPTITRNLADEVLIWRSYPCLVEYEKNLLEVVKWWVSLSHKTVTWEMFDKPYFCSNLPLLSHQLTLENTQLHNSTLYWSRAGESRIVSLRVKEIILDRELHHIEFVPECHTWEYPSRHRVKLNGAYF